MWCWTLNSLVPLAIRISPCVWVYGVSFFLCLSLVTAAVTAMHPQHKASFSKTHYFSFQFSLAASAFRLPLLLFSLFFRTFWAVCDLFPFEKIATSLWFRNAFSSYFSVFHLLTTCWPTSKTQFHQARITFSLGLKHLRIWNWPICVSNSFAHGFGILIVSATLAGRMDYGLFWLAESIVSQAEN